MTENPYSPPAVMSEMALPPEKADHWRAVGILALIMTIIIRVPVPSIGVWIHFFVAPVSFVITALMWTYGGDLGTFLSIFFLIFAPIAECQFYGGLIDTWIYRRRLRQFQFRTEQAEGIHEGNHGTVFVPGAAVNYGSALVKAPRADQ